MTQHLVAFNESQDSATLVNVAAVPDPSVSVSGDDITIPNFASQLAAIYAGGVNMTQARVLAPSLRGFANIDIAPGDVLAEPISRPPIQDYFSSPIPLNPGEALNAQAAEDGAATRSIIGCWLADSPAVPATGEVRSVRFTGTQTLVANNWTNCAIVLDQDLPAGEFDIVGLRVEGVSAIFARLVIPGSAFRPGCVAFDSYADIDNPRFRLGATGIWGRFDRVQQPTLDVLATAADTAQTGWLDLIHRG